MKKNWTGIIKLVILAGYILLLGLRLLDGKITWYINNRFVPLTVFAVIFLTVVWVTSLLHITHKNHDHLDHEDIEEHEEGHSHAQKPVWELLVLAIPLILGFTIQPQPLSSASVDLQGVNLSSSTGYISQESINPMTLIQDDLNILELLQLVNQDQTGFSVNEMNANIIGFVYEDPRLPDGQFMAGRFVITCCAADAFPVGVMIDPGDLDGSFPVDTWVQVKGPVSIVRMDNMNIPLIQAESIEIVDPPIQPYLFP